MSEQTDIVQEILADREKGTARLVAEYRERLYTAAFALCVFMAMPIYGIQNAGVRGYFKKYIEPTPIMLPMNVLSDFSSTFALAFRLYGNMLSGAILASVLMMLVPFLVPLPMQILGLVTGMIQAYVFALLAIVYVSSVSPKQPFEDRLNFY